jgi:hypothetical protein
MILTETCKVVAHSTMTNPKKGRIQETHQEYALKLIELPRELKKSTVKIMREARGGRDLVGT